MRITGLGWSCMQYKVSPSYFMYKLRQPVLIVNGGKDLRVFDVQQPSSTTSPTENKRNTKQGNHTCAKEGISMDT